MNTKELLNEFKRMSLSKQGLIVICSITLLILVLQNKNLKDVSLKFIDNLTADKTVKEFMEKVEVLVKKIAEAVRTVVGLNKEEGSEDENK